MDKRHENKNTNIKAMDQFFIDKQPTKAPIYPALTTKVAAFHGIAIQIQTQNGQLIALTKGARTEQKSDAQDAMLNLLFRINANLRSVANEGTGKALQKLTSISDSDLAGLRDTEQRDYANEIYKEAVANETALADFGVDDPLLAELKTLIDNFNTMIGMSGEAPKEVSALRKSLYALFPKAETALKDIDDTMRSYETSDPDFYNEYILLRPVRALGIRHKHPPQPANTPQAAATK